MADITPTDIVNKEFRVTFRGYAQGEVDDLLQQASDSLFHALEDAQRLRGEVEELKGRIQQYQQTENLIKNALVLAERTADELRHHAHEEADLIRRKAEEELRRERTELEGLRQTRYRIIAELRAMLHAHLSMLDAQENRPLPASEPARGEDG